MRLIYCLFLCLILTECLPAQKLLSIRDSLELNIELIGPEQGLSQGQINGIAEDQEGYLWIATKDGLNRYDGHSFRVFRNDPDNPYSISENFITAVYVDSRNLLWVGTNSSGLELFDRKHERFIHISNDKAIQSNEQVHNVSRIIEDFSGHIIIHDLTGSKIQVISSKNINNTLSYLPQTKLLELYPGLKNLDLPLNGFNLLAITKDGTLWYAENKAVYGYNFSSDKESYRIDAKSILLHPNAAPYVQTSVDKYQLLQNLYFLDSKNCISKIDLCTQSLMPDFQVSSVQRLGVNQLFFDRNNRIWINQGVLNFLRINSEKGILDTVKINPIFQNKWDNLSFEILCQDKHDNIWCGTNGYGLIKLSARNDLFAPVNFNYREPTFILYDKNERKLYRNKFKNYDLNFINQLNLENEGLQKNWVPWRFALDRHNSLWCIADHLLKYYTLKIDPDDHSYVKKAINPKDAYPVLFSDLNGDIWLCSVEENKLPRIYRQEQNINNIKFLYFPINQYQGDRNFICDWKFTEGNQFWLATIHGLFNFNPKTETWKKFQAEKNNQSSLASNYVLSLCFDPVEPTRYLWVGTDGGGLHKFDFQSERFTRYSIKDGLPNNVIYGIQSDQHGNLWISTNYGLCHFNPRNLEIQNFTSKDGLPGNEFNRTQYFNSDEGKLIFGGVNGWTSINPENYYKNKKPSRIVINRIKLLNKEIFYNTGDSSESIETYKLPLPIEHCKRLEFQYNHRMISFGFSVLDLTNPSGNRYKYKMDGFNKDWIDAGTTNEATYTNLSSGQYTFRVFGCNSSNVWSELPASIEIIIHPPWWASWWFRICILITVMGGIYLFYQYRLRQALKIQAIRNHIAADLHDEIGSTLSSISLASSLIQQKIKSNEPDVNVLLNNINNNSENIMESMSDIVWAVNVKNDRFDSVVNRIRAFAFEILEPQNIQIHFDIQPQVNLLELNMQQRKNVYLIVKEAINNVAKFSNCKNFWLNIDYLNRRLSISINDDGKGFEYSQNVEGINLHKPDEDIIKNFSGNGLYNMQKRAEDLNGKFSISSTPNKGTLIEFDFII